MNFNTNNTGTGTNSRPSSIFLKEYSVKCRYCGAEKKYATSSENKIKPRLRCNCGGRYQDGKSRMHREWDILDNGNGFSNNGFIPSIDNVSEQSIYNQILALPTKCFALEQCPSLQQQSSTVLLPPASHSTAEH